MSDTPRTDARLIEGIMLDGRVEQLDRVYATFARTLERELNAANAIIKQQQLLDEENLRLQDRIKQLEERNYKLLEQNHELRTKVYPYRNRVPIEKKLAIAEAPQNISISELARKFDVSYGTVVRYRRQIKGKEAKP